MKISLRLLAILLLFVSWHHQAIAATIAPSTYCDVHGFAVYLRDHIPRGTPKADVEKLLVDQNGATVQLDDAPRNKPNVLHYNKRIYCPPIGDRQNGDVNVTYDKNGRVWALSAAGAPGVIPSVIPADRSDAGIFNFDDYSAPDDLSKTLGIMFPLGTPRSDIEKVLVKWNAAYAWTNPNEPQTVIYTHDTRFQVPNGKSYKFAYRTWTMKISYIPKFNEVSQINVSGSVSQAAFPHDREYFIKLNKRYKEQP
jgi:hypothetical protein